MLSMHTSPLEQPGSGDAGGLNVYVVELARRLAEAGTEIEIFTRATSSDVPPVCEPLPGVTVRSVTAGPYQGLSKGDLPAQLCAFTAAVLRAEAAQEPDWYDLVHSHYWLSGQVGYVAAERWGVPLVHTAHTLGRVKNRYLADGDEPEPLARLIGEEQVVEAADRLIASTAEEAGDLVELYDADPGLVHVVPPGVDLEVFRPGEASTARTRLGVPPDGVLLAFVGRIQPLKAPDVLLRAAAVLLERDPGLRGRLVVAVVGGPSGTGLRAPAHLQHLAAQLGIADAVRFVDPLPADRLADVYRAADLVAVPSHHESFGLVALEAQACGTPVVAASVGGLRTAVADGVSGVLVQGHDPVAWAGALDSLVRQPRRRAALGAGALAHAGSFGWAIAADRTSDVYDRALAARWREQELLVGGRPTWTTPAASALRAVR
ncbi:MAG TPA: D-inositol-3-phosphate glycosyltransferase [Mycobacteriales bacterium]|nr:D-inositol-3-phosphate glycosyltransferase [Mycobacteriales bacterium]